MMISSPPLLVAMVTSFALVSRASGLCEFPAEWSGNWFRSGMGQQGSIVITRSSISYTGDCIELGNKNRYLVREEKYNCHKCMVINMKHKNVIQYKESYCDESKDFKALCMEITGDAMLYSMFRLGADPVSCPFHGPLTFTYSKGYGECALPLSQVDSCAEDSRLLFRHQACADISGSESFVEELVCLGSWKEGSNHYLVGKIDHLHANSDEDRYRCFIFEHPHHQENPYTWNLAQSADATCQGLIYPHEGSKTMKLTKVTHTGKKCKFPTWLTTHQHWHTLDYSLSYYIYHHNTSLRISNGTQAPEDLETRGQTDLRLVCHRYENHRTTTGTEHHDHHEHRRSEHNTGEHHKHHRDHRDHRSNDHNEEDHVTVVAHVTVGCKSGYQCLRIYRRDEHVVQVQSGELAFTADEACSSHYWSPVSANVTTLVAVGGPPGPCGPFGRYRVRDPLTPCAGKAPTFTHVTVGCDNGNTLELSSRCPEESVYAYHCHGHWESEGVIYVVASPMSRASLAPRRVCFAYSETTPTPGHPSHTLSLTARHDTCIHRQHDAPIALNATLAEQCMQAAITSSSMDGGAMALPSFRLLLSTFLIVLLLPPNARPL